MLPYWAKSAQSSKKYSVFPTIFSILQMFPQIFIHITHDIPSLTMRYHRVMKNKNATRM